MKTIHVTAATTPEGNGQFRPKFGVDFPAYGAKGQDLKSMPAAIPGTFLDLISPKIPGKGRVRAAHTFKALSQVIGRAMVRDLYGALLPEDRKSDLDLSQTFSDQTLTELYNNVVPNLGKFIKVKRVDTGWEIQLPVMMTNLQTIFSLCMPQKKEYMADGELNLEGRKAMSRVAMYAIPTLAQLGWKFDKSKANFSMPAERIAKTFSGDFLNVNAFYAKYTNSFQLQMYSTAAMNNLFSDLSINSIKDIEATDDVALASFIGNALASNIVVRAVVILPDEEAPYYTQSAAKEIKAYQVLDFFYRWYKYAFTSKLDLPTFTHSFVSPIKKNEGFIPKPRTNKLGLVLTSKNYLMYVPNHAEVNKLHEYADAYERFSGTEEGYATIASKPSEDLKQQVQFQLVYVDWVNNKVLYTGETPNLMTIDLDNTYSCTNFTIASFLYSEIKPTGANGFTDYVLNLCQRNEAAFGDTQDVGNFMQGMDFGDLADKMRAVNPVAAENFMRKVNASTPLYAYINAVIDFLHDVHVGENKHYSKEIPKEFEYPIRAKDCTENAANPLLVPVGRWIKQTYSKVMKDPFAYINKCQRSPYVTMQSIANLIVWNEARNFQSYLDADKKEREVYITQDVLDPNYEAAFPNSGGLSGLQPHQNRVMNASRKLAKNVIVAVAAGGGKTIITITDVLRSLAEDWKKVRKEERAIKKCLVICPSYLMKDYVSEINYVSKGTINPIPFDTRVFAAYAGTEDTQYTGRRDYSNLKALVDNAPPNTIFITGYDTYSRSGNEVNVYGGELVYGNAHIDFMRSCQFDAVWMDESHFLKSAESGRAKAIELLISDIPYKRLLTGTIVPNTLVDLVRQVGFFNPGILGNEEDFRRTYSEGGDSTGAFVARQGAEQEIFRQLKNHVVFQNVQRKEWAALLPKMREEFVPAYLTENQRKVYDILVGEMLDEMQGDGEAKDAFKGSSGTDMTGENDEDIEHVFDKYERNLSAIESFLASPMAIPISEQYLIEDADKESPKGKEVLQILRRHLSNPTKYPGKIIIFCNTYASVEGIYKDFPPDIQHLTIKYSAETKTEDEAEFKTNPKKRIIIGISQSMETGLNLQIADTLIRIDNVWSPGRFEQGLARINRPDLKSDVDPRMATGLFMYYITVDRTIDVLKTARLTSKTVQVARFYNAGTTDYKYYENIGIDETGAPIQPMPISFENLRTGLSWNDLEKYVRAYGEYRNAEDLVFEDFRNRFPNIKRVPVKHTGLLKGSALLKRIPYTPGMQIFGARELGLVPYNEYKRKFIEKNGEDKWDPKNLPLHTAYGDGICNGEGKLVNVSLYQGGSVSLYSAVLFVITKKVTSTKEIREQLSDITNMEMVDIQLENYRISNRKSKAAQKELEKKLKESQRQLRSKRQQQEVINPNDVVRKDSRRKSEETPIAPADEQTNKIINLYLTLTNQLIALATSVDDPDVLISEFKHFGFQALPSYWFIELKTVAALDEFITKIDKLNSEEKIVLKDEYFYMLEGIEGEFKQGRSKLLKTTQKTQTDIGHFLIDRRRKISDPKEVRPLPMIVDGVLYICVDIRTHSPSAITAIKRIKVPGSQWELQDNTLAAFFTKKSDVLSTIKEIKANGYTIENENELKETYTNLRVLGK